MVIKGDTRSLDSSSYGDLIIFPKPDSTYLRGTAGMRSEGTLGTILVHKRGYVGHTFAKTLAGFDLGCTTQEPFTHNVDPRLFNPLPLTGIRIGILILRP